MLARDWYYNERRRIGLDSAVASIYDRHDDSDIRARAALTMLGVQRGWRVADIGCGNGVLACEAAQMGADVDAIDPAVVADRVAIDHVGAIAVHHDAARIERALERGCDHGRRTVLGEREHAQRAIGLRRHADLAIAGELDNRLFNLAAICWTTTSIHTAHAAMPSVHQTAGMATMPRLRA